MQPSIVGFTHSKDIGRQEGFEEIEVFTSLAPAMQTMEQALDGKRPLPHALILDLKLGSDSGSDLLRLWHRTRKESKVRLVVWTELSDGNREVCEFFKVDAYVNKWDSQALCAKL
jgi:DNA-binding response OmpR family regulator